jgi:hypothetical protein
MSKTELKKHLQSLTKEQVIEQVLELYGNCKPAKVYLEYFLKPDEKGQFEKYKAIIINEFSEGKRMPKMRFSVAKKAISDFRQLNPSPLLYGDLMLTLAEAAWKLAYNLSDLWEQYYDSAANNYEAALKFLQKNNLLDNFKLRCLDCVKHSRYCGYGFEDQMDQLFKDYYE